MDHGEQRWRRAVHLMLLHTAFEDYRAYLRVIPHLPLVARKELLKIARCQSSPNYNSFLAQQTTILQIPRYRNMKFFADGDAHHPVIYLKDLVKTLSDACHHNPAFSSILSVLLRSAPIFLLSTETVQKNKTDSFEKELESSLGPDRPQVLDYSLFFSEHPDFDKPLSIYLPPAPLRNRDIHRRFTSWRQRMLDRPLLLFPQLTSYRNISRETCHHYHEFHGRPDGLFEGLYDVNAIDLERTYADFGVEIQGACELRQSWKFNDLTPRTYFALGGTAFHDSKYIRQIANQLCNLFDPTGFKSRFSIARIPVRTENSVYTYDYSSFTSNFTELKYFLRELAEYLGGVPIQVIDSRHGLTTMDSMDLILNYLESTTYHPKFTVNRYLETCFDHFTHNKAGMLGVYGNIALSTGLHGLHACQLCGDDGECNCVGDDVLGEGPLEEYFFDAVSSLGTINPEKVKIWNYKDPGEDDGLNDQRWPFTKRPLDRFGNKMFLETAYFMPIFGAIIPTVDQARDIKSEEITETEIRILAVQGCSLVRQLKASPPEDEDQVISIMRYMTSLYLICGITMKGVYPWSVKMCGDIAIRNLLLPSIESFVPPFDLWDQASNTFQLGSHKVPEALYPSDEMTHGWRKIVEGPRICFDNQVLSYGRKLGYLDVRPRYVDRTFDSLKEYSDYYDEMFDRTRLRTYDVEYLDGPQWFHELVTNDTYLL